jgi:plastocyanin
VRQGFPQRSVVAAILLLGSCVPAWRLAGNEKPVTAHAKVQKSPSSKEDKPEVKESVADVVVWLKPLDSAVLKSSGINPLLHDVAGDPSGKRPQVIQRNKSFHPHLTVVRVGSVVDFPNHDPFFHNVFSLFDGKRFDLGLYEAGATNSVRFDHVGVSYLFCNIHPEMSAVVVAVDTPFYGVSDKAGNIALANVPDGKYEVHVWYERSSPGSLKELTRLVQLSSESRDLGTITVQQDPSFTPAHKNKYGQDYAPPPKEGYPQP